MSEEAIGRVSEQAKKRLGDCRISESKNDRMVLTAAYGDYARPKSFSRGAFQAI